MGFKFEASDQNKVPYMAISPNSLCSSPFDTDRWQRSYGKMLAPRAHGDAIDRDANWLSESELYNKT